MLDHDQNKAYMEHMQREREIREALMTALDMIWEDKTTGVDSASPIYAFSKEIYDSLISEGRIKQAENFKIFAATIFSMSPKIEGLGAMTSVELLWTRIYQYQGKYEDVEKVKAGLHKHIDNIDVENNYTEQVTTYPIGDKEKYLEKKIALSKAFGQWGQEPVLNNED